MSASPRLPSNRPLHRLPQARQSLQRDIQSNWYYRRLSGMHNGKLFRQEYRITYYDPPSPIGPDTNPQEMLDYLNQMEGTNYALMPGGQFLTPCPYPVTEQFVSLGPVHPQPPPPPSSAIYEAPPPYSAVVPAAAAPANHRAILPPPGNGVSGYTANPVARNASGLPPIGTVLANAGLANRQGNCACLQCRGQQH